MDSNFIFSLLIAYLLGSIPFPYLIAKGVKGIDLRKVGSRNVGGRNLTRNLGFGWGLLGGALDVAKGLAAMAATRALGVPYPLAYWAGPLAVAGHNWPLWLRFRGGKGLATALGAALYVIPLEAAVAFGVGLLILRLTQNILLTALAAFASIFVLIEVLGRGLAVRNFALGLFLMVLIAATPDILDKLRRSGGVREYMRDPNQVYEE